jgi:uncharacterized protein
MRREVSSSPEHSVRTDNKWRIPVSSGIHLGATVTQPVEPGCYPALVWYDPYRSGVEGATSPLAEYFARRGYAFVYLNVRGTGNSEGFSTDEYTVHETQDGADAIAWLAEQPWCSGKIGMLGASYSGFNTLQVAALAPPALKAIAPAYFTDRRYTDDCHYKGGCLRGYYDMLTYGLSMVAMNALPPHAEAVGSAWSDLWRLRLEDSEPYLLKWLAHQTEDEYWSTGSISGKYDAIKAATFLIGGWHDGYLNPPLRVFRQLTAPRKLLMGPWSHAYPDQSHCGPRIDINFELLRWWDYWLKGMDNGVMGEPAVQVYEQRHESPIPDRTSIAGRWRTAADLPPNDDKVAAPTYFLHGSRADSAPAPKVGSASVTYLPAASRNGGLWDAGVSFNLPGEQSEDSARAINFVGTELAEDLCILGSPTFDLYVSANMPVAPFAVRLLDVDPQGVRVLVTKGILNVTRRNGMRVPEALPLDEIVCLTYHLEATSWRFAKGHRIQISVNGSDFPNVWPTPDSGEIRVHWGPDHPSRITLPVWEGGRDPTFSYLPSQSGPNSTGSGSAPWQIIYDVLEERYRFRMDRGNGEMGVSHRDPSQAWVQSKQRRVMDNPGQVVVSEATGSLVSNRDHFIINLALNVTLNGASHFQKQWTDTFGRELL